MKRLIGVVCVLALLVAVAPAMAADVFHAFSQLPTQERAALTPLPDDQLASIEGQAVCVTCVAIVIVTQLNIAVGSSADQVNFAAVNVNEGSFLRRAR
jgi:hypothetical protein